MFAGRAECALGRTLQSPQIQQCERCGSCRTRTASAPVRCGGGEKAALWRPTDLLVDRAGKGGCTGQAAAASPGLRNVQETQSAGEM